MSHIDDAFLNAYATPRPLSDAVVLGAPSNLPPQPPTSAPLAGLHHGPHISMPPVVQPQQTVSRVASAVAQQQQQMAKPHFQVPGGQMPQAAPATTTATQATTTKARQPLSSFSALEQPTATAFQPVFEVDGFRWPKLTDDLLGAYHKLLIPVADRLLDKSEQGRSLVGIAGTRLGIGCTTVQMCLARLIASTGKSVAMVDGNFAKASLGRELGLEFQMGWEHVLAGEMPLAECVVKSVNDRMVLLPLVAPGANATELLASLQTSVTAGVLRYHYDVVLFNLGAASHGPQQMAAYNIMQHCRLDASIIVADTMSSPGEPAHGVDSALMNPLMSLLGATCLGVVGNRAA